MKANGLVFEIEDQCDYFAQDIRNKICRNIIDSLNEKMTGVEGDGYKVSNDNWHTFSTAIRLD